VTRWAQFGDCFLWGSFKKITKWATFLFYCHRTVIIMYQIWQKSGWSSISAIFSQTHQVTLATTNREYTIELAYTHWNLTTQLLRFPWVRVTVGKLQNGLIQHHHYMYVCWHTRYTLDILISLACFLHGWFLDVPRWIERTIARQDMPRVFLQPSWAGLPDFSWWNIPKRENICHIATKYT
jgi:hypothetical protein